jgi:hypothetical protein
MGRIMSDIHDQTVEFIADHTKEMAVMAQDAEQETLAYILRMAELEARNVLTSKRTKQKHAA